MGRGLGRFITCPSVSLIGVGVAVARGVAVAGAFGVVCECANSFVAVAAGVVSTTAGREAPALEFM